MRSTRQPSAASAASITCVSSDSSRSWIVVVPWLRAASSSTRFEMLFEPGRRTVPLAASRGGRSRNRVWNMRQRSAVLQG